MPKSKISRVSDAELPLRTTIEEAETRKQIAKRKGLSMNRVREFLEDLDAKGILRAKRVLVRLPGGVHGTTIVYWIET